MEKIQIALIEPEIPGNTGSIARTCVATDTFLTIVGPIPFDISDKQVRRAGLDYWPHLRHEYLNSFEEFLKKYQNRRLILTSARLGENYSDFKFQKGDILLMGKETMGIEKGFLHSGKHPVVHLPMWGETRSLNLANASTVFLYEAYRQLGFGV
ncbi:MAG: tRNA (uridine(34)/cytosine(34)/5-carboxymethylaminomethyluridine(34)-2'-O)-methyltransferase TrmL [Candidatus Cloacimonadota bacterium]|nr:MAG: tRNA (uridine(34)/cytosine(34)/5-carboxymethylaminomethyluridine(34)-2'-O)-methyltransferase TrmL [Candidatus Cloacimonadota bacterium]